MMFALTVSMIVRLLLSSIAWPWVVAANSVRAVTKSAVPAPIGRFTAVPLHVYCTVTTPPVASMVLPSKILSPISVRSAQHLMAVAAAARQVVGDELRIRPEHGAELVLVGMRSRFGLVEERVQRVDRVGDVVDRLDEVVGRRQRRGEVGRGRVGIELELRLDDLVDEAAHRRDENLRGRGHQDSVIVLVCVAFVASSR